MPPVIADTLKLEQAFALVSPRRVAHVLRQDRHTAYAAREAIREAVARQDPAWQAEFWQQVHRYDVPLCQ
jgi:hypothetical protein